MKEGTTSGARAQSAIQRAAVLYKPRLATFNFLNFLGYYVPRERSETIIILNENGNVIMQFEMYVTVRVT
jgi:hypothetical protein